MKTYEELAEAATQVIQAGGRLFQLDEPKKPQLRLVRSQADADANEQALSDYREQKTSYNQECELLRDTKRKAEHLILFNLVENQHYLFEVEGTVYLFQRTVRPLTGSELYYREWLDYCLEYQVDPETGLLRPDAVFED